MRANKEWLARKSKEEGVFPLSKGVFYKVISPGDPKGKSPSPRSIITVHYTGCTIEGKQFDSSRGGVPLAIRLSDVIEGWVIALQRMTQVTVGKYTFPPNADTANSLYRGYLLVLHWYSISN